MPKQNSNSAPAQPKIQAFSKADSVAGQGVGSAYLEQVALIQSELSSEFQINPRAKVGDFGEINHFHSINPEFRAAIPFAKRRGRTLAHVHFIPETVEDSLSLPGPIKKAFYRYLLNFYRSTDSLVTVNPWFIKRLSDGYGFDASKITYIPNFVSETQFYPIPVESETGAKVAQRRLNWGAAPGQFVVMCAGQLQTRKGFFDMVEIARAMPEILFIWAGGYSFGKISSGYAEIEKAITTLPANMKLIGMVPRDEMNECFNAADLFFLPSYEELFPMTILEAMAAGTPILVRELEYYEGVLFDFATRIPAKRGELDGFIAEIKALSSGGKQLEAATAAARRGAQKYSRQAVAKQWRNYYQSLL